MFSKNVLSQQYNVHNTDDTNKIDNKNNDRKKRDLFDDLRNTAKNVAQIAHDNCANNNFARNVLNGALDGASSGSAGRVIVGTVHGVLRNCV